MKAHVWAVVRLPWGAVTAKKMLYTDATWRRDVLHFSTCYDSCKEFIANHREG